jgi:hypothetical protein
MELSARKLSTQAALRRMQATRTSRLDLRRVEARPVEDATPRTAQRRVGAYCCGECERLTPHVGCACGSFLLGLRERGCVNGHKTTN